MWYAASEIIFFLIVAAVIGGMVGYGIGQIYQLDFESLRRAMAARKDDSEELAAVRVENADLRRKLDLMTAALRGDDQPATDSGFPEPTTAPAATDSTGHADTVAVGGNGEGRRLSERVADAGRD